MKKRTKVKRILKTVPILPTCMTLANIGCGFGAIVYIAMGFGESSHNVVMRNFTMACWLILGAMIFDMLDGRVARITKQTSEFGKQLDSLADIVSFGVAPAFIAKVLITYFCKAPHLYHLSKDLAQNIDSFLVGVYVICAALRLARYNVESEGTPTHNFVGLPSPAAAGALVTLALLALTLESQKHPQALVLFRILPMYMLLLGGLMVSRVRYVHIANRYLRGGRNLWQVFLMVLFVAIHLLNLKVMLAITFNAFIISGIINEVILTVKPKNNKLKDTTPMIEETQNEQQQ